jgi:nucleoside-diphosphate-sugar epimerase
MAASFPSCMVIGGRGFLGTNLCIRLLSRGGAWARET